MMLWGDWLIIPHWGDWLIYHSLGRLAHISLTGATGS